jgi:hypothetical protein
MYAYQSDISIYMCKINLRAVSWLILLLISTLKAHAFKVTPITMTQIKNNKM